MFFLSVFIPIYTYAIYPVILLFFREKQYGDNNDFLPSVSVLLVPDKSGNLTDDKLESLHNLKYSDYEVLTCEGLQGEGFVVIGDVQTEKTSTLNRMIKAAQGEIIVFTDYKTPIDPLAVKSLVKHFADEQVGCVVGQLRSESPSTFWKYENYVRRKEGKLGRVSGANKAIYAVRRDLIEAVPENIMNIDFYISTLVQQKGYDVLFEPEAIAYEQPDEQADHIKDGTGYFQALRVFWRMLLPRKGSFVYWSHRVLKWMVPFCLPILLITSFALSFKNALFVVLFMLQIVGYFLVILREKTGFKGGGAIGKLLDLVTYFLRLNFDWFKGYLG